MVPLLAAILRAISSAAWRNSARGTTFSTAPSRCASAAPIGSPVKYIIRTFCSGNRRCRWAPPPMAPRSTSGTPNVASSAATTMSAAPARPMPPPSTKPCTATITGSGLRCTASKLR
jgi:hypothetical protein